MKTKNEKDKMILVTSGYGANTKEPYVSIEAEFLDTPLQISPNEARALGLNLLEAADAAETDAFIVEFFKGQMDQPDAHVVALLRQFREFRKKRADKDKGVNRFAG